MIIERRNLEEIPVICRCEESEEKLKIRRLQLASDKGVRNLSMGKAGALNLKDVSKGHGTRGCQGIKD